MSKWPSDNDKEVWFNHKENEWHNNEGEICELYSGVDHDGTKYSFFTNQAYWDCECDEDYIHKKTEQKHCTKCDTFHEEQPDSRQHEIDAMFEKLKNRKYEYELFLSQGKDGKTFTVDVREDIIEFGDLIESDFIEKHSFNSYGQAENKLGQIVTELSSQKKTVHTTNEVKTLHTILGRKLIREEDELKQESNLWSVNLNTIFKNVLFDCTEDELEENVRTFVVSELGNLDWTYEKADVNVDKTMIRS